MKSFMMITMFVYSLAAAPIEKTIDELLQGEEVVVEKIHTYDPFYRTKPLIEKKKIFKHHDVPKKLEVIAIMNKKAFIDNKWLEEGELVRDAKIIKITSETVYLKSSNKTIILDINKKKKLLGIRQKEEQ